MIRMLTINTSIQKNEKFTTASLGCFLRLPLTSHNLAYASLLAKMQMNATLYFPTINKQQEELSKMYDLQFEAVPQLFGKDIILSYVANFVEPIEILDPEYTYAKIIEDLALIIEHPTLDDQIIALSKRQLSSDYQEIMAEPANFALDRFFKIWYQNEPDYAENFMGPIDEIENATSKDLKLFVDNLKMVPATVIGLVKDPDLVDHLVKEEFKYPGLMKNFTESNLTIPAPKRDLQLSDVHNNLQAQLFMGYGYDLTLPFYGQIVGQVLGQYLAGDPSSELFTKIREEAGAAYAVEANNYANNSLFLINAGLDPNKVEEAKAIIKGEIEAIAAGEIDSDLLKKSKKALLNIQLIGKDKENWRLAQMLRGELFDGYSLFDRENAIKRVTETQLAKFAKNLFLNESYVLR